MELQFCFITEAKSAKGHKTKIWGSCGKSRTLSKSHSDNTVITDELELTKREWHFPKNLKGGHPKRPTWLFNTEKREESLLPSAVFDIDHTSWSPLCVPVLQQIMSWNDPKLLLSLHCSVLLSSGCLGQLLHCCFSLLTSWLPLPWWVLKSPVWLIVNVSSPPSWVQVALSFLLEALTEPHTSNICWRARECSINSPGYCDWPIFCAPHLDLGHWQILNFRTLRCRERHSPYWSQLTADFSNSSCLSDVCPSPTRRPILSLFWSPLTDW